jgi:hypothetical protein
MSTQTQTEEEGDSTERNPIWEDNHVRITLAMDWLLRENERWPTKTEIARRSGLSRQTVHKHLEDFDKEDYGAENVKGLRFMSSKLMMRMCQKAMDGDAKCLRLAFEMTGDLKKGRNAVNGKK